MSTCRKCGAEMSPGVALENILTGSPDFSGGEVVTFSTSGRANMVDCLKCVRCGHGVTQENAKNQTPKPTPDDRLEAMLKPWKSPRFGVFLTCGRFEELAVDNQSYANHPCANTARWVGGHKDVQLLRAALLADQEPLG